MHDIPKPTSKPVKFYLGRLFNQYQKNYEKHIGKRLLKGIKTGEGGSAFAGGFLGFISDPDIEDDFKSPALIYKICTSIYRCSIWLWQE